MERIDERDLVKINIAISGSARNLAADLFVSEATIANWLRGRRRPPLLQRALMEGQARMRLLGEKSHIQPNPSRSMTQSPVSCSGDEPLPVNHRFDLITK